MFLSFTSTPTDDMLPLRGIGWPQKLLCWLGVICCWPTGMLLSGWILLAKVPCLVVSARIGRDARWISSLSKNSRCGRLEQRDLDVVEQLLESAHAHTARLAAILQPLLELMLCIPMIAGSWWLLLGCTPWQSSMDPRSPVRDVMEHVPNELFIGGAALLMIAGLWPLYAPAAVSTACDELVAAVQALSPANQPAETAVLSEVDATPQKGGCDQPNAREDVAAKVDSLVQNVASLNCGKGLGFTLRRKRIDATLVNRAIGLAFGFALSVALVLLLILT